MHDARRIREREVEHRDEIAACIGGDGHHLLAFDHDGHVRSGRGMTRDQGRSVRIDPHNVEFGRGHRGRVGIGRYFGTRFGRGFRCLVRLEFRLRHGVGKCRHLALACIGLRCAFRLGRAFRAVRFVGLCRFGRRRRFPGRCGWFVPSGLGRLAGWSLLCRLGQSRDLGGCLGHLEIGPWEIPGRHDSSHDCDTCCNRTKRPAQPTSQQADHSYPFAVPQTPRIPKA